MKTKNLEISDIPQFIKFIENNKEDLKFFHPHKFDIQSLEELINKNKDDIYTIFLENYSIIAYGILRGWDEGYSIPSLGILIDKNFRGKGYSNLIMNILHDMCKEKKCEKIRLTVIKNNIVAINLYKKLGYEFEDYSEDSLIGFLKIN